MYACCVLRQSNGHIVSLHMIAFLHTQYWVSLLSYFSFLSDIHRLGQIGNKFLLKSWMSGINIAVLIFLNFHGVRWVSLVEKSVNLLLAYSRTLVMITNMMVSITMQIRLFY